MKVKITAHVHYRKYRWEPEGVFEIFSVRLDDSDSCTYVGEREVEVEVPDNYDPTAQQIAALEEQKEKAAAEYHSKVREINERISSLQALEYTP